MRLLSKGTIVKDMGKRIMFNLYRDLHGWHDPLYADLETCLDLVFPSAYVYFVTYRNHNRLCPFEKYYDDITHDIRYRTMDKIIQNITEHYETKRKHCEASNV